MSKLHAFVVAMVMCLLSTAALADSITFKFKSNAEYSVGLEFTSQDRNHQWPGDGNAYKIDDYDTHTYKLSCITGENICYGAWVENRDDLYWGVGMDNGNHCDDCCYICRNHSKVNLIHLNE